MWQSQVNYYTVSWLGHFRKWSTDRYSNNFWLNNSNFWTVCGTNMNDALSLTCRKIYYMTSTFAFIYLYKLRIFRIEISKLLFIRSLYPTQFRFNCSFWFHLIKMARLNCFSICLLLFGCVFWSADAAGMLSKESRAAAKLK